MTRLKQAVRADQESEPRPCAIASRMIGVIAAGTMSILSAGAASAAENGNSQYAFGASQFYAGAIPPFPGLFALSQTNYYTANRTNDGDGHKVPIDFDVQAVAEALRFLYVSDVKLGDAVVWGQLVVPLVNVDLSIRPFVDDSNFGLADITLTSGLAWYQGKSTYSFGLDVVMPTGAYDGHDPVNVGLNHWSLQPTLAYKYFDPAGWEIAVMPRLIFNFENPDTNYTTGTEFEADYAVGYNIGKFKVGAVGYVYQQFSDDKQDGSKVGTDGNRSATFAVGPSLTYSLNPGLQLSASWQHEVYAEHTSQGDKFWFNVATKLW